MRILHILSQYVGETGSGIYLQSLVSEGKKKGHIQGVVSGVNDGNYRYEEFDYYYPIKFNTDRVSFPIVAMSDAMPYESKKFSDLTFDELKILKSIYKEAIELSIAEFKPDLIITNHLWLISSMVKDIAKTIKVIGICHGTDLRQLELTPTLKEEVIKGIAKLDRVFSLSNEQKEEIVEKYSYPESKIDIIGGGYNSDIFYFKDPAFKKNNRYDEIILIYCGKLSYSKGVVELVKATLELSNRYEVRLELVGTGIGKQYEDIRSLIEGHEDIIHYRGRMEQKELGKLLRESDIFIMPSYYEGLSLITIEALATGNLVVSNDLLSLKSYLGDEINNSGLIEYIDAPKMKTIDIPSEIEVSSYIERIIQGIELQIERVYDKTEVDEKLLNEINTMSWHSIYKMIEKNFKKL